MARLLNRYHKDIKHEVQLENPKITTLPFSTYQTGYEKFHGRICLAAVQTTRHVPVRNESEKKHEPEKLKSKQLLAKVFRATVPDKSEYSQLPVIRYLNTALADCSRCGVTRRYVLCTVKD